MERHFTASVYVIHQSNVLLLFHPKLNKWLPPGGHLENHETPPEAARREVLEETGLDIEFLQDHSLDVDYPNAKSIERPFLCLLEEIPPYKDTPSHQHIDFIYLATPKQKRPTLKDSKDPLLWFSFSAIDQMEGEQEIFQETKDVIKAIFNHIKQVPLKG